MTSQPGNKVVILVWPNISRSKNNQTMKFGQLTETWEIFSLKNHTQNKAKKIFPDPFVKSQNWAYVWINTLNFIICIYCRPS